MSALTPDNVSVMDSSLDPEKTHNTELTVLDLMNDNPLENFSELAQVAVTSRFVCVKDLISYFCRLYHLGFMICLTG